MKGDEGSVGEEGHRPVPPRVRRAESLAAKPRQRRRVDHDMQRALLQRQRTRPRKRIEKIEGCIPLIILL